MEKREQKEAKKKRTAERKSEGNFVFRAATRGVFRFLFVLLAHLVRMNAKSKHAERNPSGHFRERKKRTFASRSSLRGAHAQNSKSNATPRGDSTRGSGRGESEFSTRRTQPPQAGSRTSGLSLNTREDASSPRAPFCCGAPAATQTWWNKNTLNASVN